MRLWGFTVGTTNRSSLHIGNWAHLAKEMHLKHQNRSGECHRHLSDLLYVEFFVLPPSTRSEYHVWILANWQGRLECWGVLTVLAHRFLRTALTLYYRMTAVHHLFGIFHYLVWRNCFTSPFRGRLWRCSLHRLHLSLDGWTWPGCVCPIAIWCSPWRL